MESNFTKIVKEFTKACAEETLPDSPVEMKEDKIAFITKMVNDELQELSEASNVAEQADALVDAIYYICDFAVRQGFDLDPIFDIVHKANMSKVVNGRVIRREDGKILKPDGWIDPDPLLQKEIGRQSGHCGKLN